MTNEKKFIIIEIFPDFISRSKLKHTRMRLKEDEENLLSNWNNVYEFLKLYLLNQEIFHRLLFRRFDKLHQDVLKYLYVVVQ